MFQKILVLFLMAALLTACGGQQEPMQGIPDSVPAEAESMLGSLPDLTAALEGAGASVEAAGKVEQPFFQVPGQMLRINGQDIQVFAYADEAARQADSSQIAPDGSAIGPNMVTWVEPPHFWAAGNLIVLYVGQDPAVIDTLTGILGGEITRPAR